MLVEKEIDNVFDAFAMVVKMPQLCNILNDSHNSVSKQKRGKESDQTVKTNAGKIVGRVPANVCKIVYGF